LIYLDSNALVYLLHDIKPKSDLVVGILSKTEHVSVTFESLTLQGGNEVSLNFSIV